MKRKFLLLTLVMSLCLSVCAACDANNSNSSDTPDVNNLPSIKTENASNPASETEPSPDLSDVPELETNDKTDEWSEEDRTAIEKVMEYSQQWGRPGYADAKPNGTDLLYKDKTVRIPYDYERGPCFDSVFVDETMAAFAYTPLEGDDPILLMCSEDQGEHWVNFEISMEGRKGPDHLYITFAGKEIGYLIVEYEDAPLIYTTHNMGKTWESSNLGNIPEPIDINGIAAKANTLYLYGETKGVIVIYTNHNDEGGWKTSKLSLTEQEYTRSHIAKFWFAPDENPLVAQIFVKGLDEDRMYYYYVSLDDGENWSFFKSELIEN